MPLASTLARIPGHPLSQRILFAFILVLCAIGNLPWHLDNYDQAKQAYVAYEIVHEGNWLYQHTPKGDTATKPPLAGWVSLPIYWVTGSWDLAWRIPGFICTVILLLLLAREGHRLWPEGGAVLAGCAFALNLLTPRIATLVRTDMMLTLFITICGWLIYRKIRQGEAWNLTEKWLFFGSMLGAVFTKGPILYAFILPGMVAFWFLSPRDRRALVWSGWWTWVIPLFIFVAWLGYGLFSNQQFYNDVVVNEFFSRFDQSLKSHEKQQPIWFYFPHLIHKFAPWSLLLIALPVFSKNVRSAVRQRPEVLWLACWAIGGLLCMTFVPSKRVDRIFPVIPPFCLLLVAMVAACQCGQKIRAWCGAAIVGAVLFSGVYFCGIVVIGYKDDNSVLVRFGREAQRLAAENGGLPVAVVNGRDEGMFMYCDADRFSGPQASLRAWQEGKSAVLVLPARRLQGDLATLANVPPTLDTGKVDKNEKRYLLFLRRE